VWWRGNCCGPREMWRVLVHGTGIAIYLPPNLVTVSGRKGGTVVEVKPV